MAKRNQEKSVCVDENESDKAIAKGKREKKNE